MSETQTRQKGGHTPHYRRFLLQSPRFQQGRATAQESRSGSANSRISPHLGGVARHKRDTNQGLTETQGAAR